MKTRSNMPLYVVECDNVKTLSNSQIDLLRCGDYLVKKDASGEHAYKVTYKKDKVGMCITYHDASVIETQSYDYVDGNWVYNSEDKTELPVNEDLQDVIDDRVETLVEGGTLDNAKPIYVHPINIEVTSDDNKAIVSLFIFDNSATPYTWETFKTWLSELVTRVTVARVLTTGCLIIGENRYPANFIFGSSSQRSFVADFSGNEILLNTADFNALTPTRFLDGVNKIN